MHWLYQKHFDNRIWKSLGALTHLKHGGISLERRDHRTIGYPLRTSDEREGRGGADCALPLLVVARIVPTAQSVNQNKAVSHRPEIKPIKSFKQMKKQSQ